jgi:hypothetical protein
MSDQERDRFGGMPRPKGVKVETPVAPEPEPAEAPRRPRGRPPKPRLLPLDDFLGYGPKGQYIHIPTRALWPAKGVDKSVDPKDTRLPKGERPSDWLMRCQRVEQIVWAPDESEIIEGKYLNPVGGEWAPDPTARIFNRYTSPSIAHGSSELAGPWLDHVRMVYPDEWEHIVRWMAHRVQRPGEKVNHALVLGGDQGVGKDTLLNPLAEAVGPANFVEVSPQQLLGQFTPFYESVVLRVSEARDLGDTNRFALYDAMKTVIAAPPNVLTVNRKHEPGYVVRNVTGVVITSNHRIGGLYLPADDRRHFVAWSPISKPSIEYFNWLYGWLEDGGNAHVAALLNSWDLSEFNPKAPPPRTSAWHEMVESDVAAEDDEMGRCIEILGNPEALRIEDLASVASSHGMTEFGEFLRDRGKNKAIAHKLNRHGYGATSNPDRDDGRWATGKKGKHVIYSRTNMVAADRQRAVREYLEGGR